MKTQVVFKLANFQLFVFWDVASVSCHKRGRLGEITGAADKTTRKKNTKTKHQRYQHKHSPTLIVGQQRNADESLYRG